MSRMDVPRVDGVRRLNRPKCFYSSEAEDKADQLNHQIMKPKKQGELIQVLGRGLVAALLDLFGLVGVDQFTERTSSRAL